MSSNQPTRRPRNIYDRILENMQQNEKNFVQSLKAVSVDSAVSFSGLGGGPAAGGGPSQGSGGGFLRTEGDTMVGPIAIGASFKLGGSTQNKITVDGSGFRHFNVSKISGWYGSYAVIVPSSGNSDTLDYIDGAAFEGQILKILVVFPYSITIHSGLVNGNIITPSGASLTINPAVSGIVSLIYDVAVGGWQVDTSPAGTGGGGINYPLEPPIKDYGTVSGAISIDLSLSTAHVHKIILNGNATISFINPPPVGFNEQFQIAVTQDNVGGWIITWPGTVNVPPQQDIVANARTVYVGQTSDNGTTYDVFNTDMAATLSSANFANKTLSNLTNPTSINQALIPNGDGTLDEGTSSDRWATIWAKRIGYDSNTFIDFSVLNTEYNVATGKSHDFRINGTSVYKLIVGELQPNTDDNLQLGDNTHALSDVWTYILNFSDSAGDPGVAGAMQRNGADVKVYSGGAVRNLSNIGAGGGGADVFLDNLNSPTAINQDLIFGTGLSGTKKNIDNVGIIYFSDSTVGGGPPHTSTNIYISTSGDSKEMDVYLDGIQTSALSTDGLTTGILQIYSKLLASLKTVSNKAGLYNNFVAGELRFDFFNDSAVEKTGAGISCEIISNSHGSESGQLQFNYIDPSLGYVEGGHLDIQGWNLDNYNIYNERHPVIVQSPSYTALLTDYLIVINDPTFIRNVNLPKSSTCPGKQYCIVQGSTQTIHIVANGTDAIWITGGSTHTWAMGGQKGTAATIMTDGLGNWWIVGFNLN